MKVKLNALGFSNEKMLRTSEGLMSGGIVGVAIGLLITTAGYILHLGTSEWVCAVHSEEGRRYFGDIYDALNTEEKA